MVAILLSLYWPPVVIARDLICSYAIARRRIDSGETVTLKGYHECNTVGYVNLVWEVQRFETLESGHITMGAQFKNHAAYTYFTIDGETDNFEESVGGNPVNFEEWEVGADNSDAVQFTLTCHDDNRKCGGQCLWIFGCGRCDCTFATRWFLYGDQPSPPPLLPSPPPSPSPPAPPFPPKPVCECDQVKVSGALSMQINGVFERWSLQTPDGRSVYRNSHNWYLYFVPAGGIPVYFEPVYGNRWLISSDYPLSLDYGSVYVRSSSDGTLCPETASGWQQDDVPIDVVCEGCPVASLSSWRVFNLDYHLDEVFQQGGMREIELAVERVVDNPSSFPISTPFFTFTSTVSNSFSFELAEESVAISGTSTANSDSVTEERGGTGRRRLAAFVPALIKAAPIIARTIPVSANT